MKKKKSKSIGIVKIFLWVVVSIFTLLFLLLIFIYSPWGQNIIINYSTKFISNKTQTEVSIDKIFVTPRGNLILKGLYLEDKERDTLIYSKSLEANLSFLPILKGSGIYLKSMDWKGLRVNVQQSDTLEGYNFQFLIDAFATENQEEEKVKTTVGEETSTDFEIRIGNIYFQDFHITYQDIVTGIDSEIKFGELEISMDKFNLEAMDFRVKNFYFSDAYIRFEQSEISETPQEETEISLPYLAINNLNLKNIIVECKLENKMKADVNLGSLQLKSPKIDLANQDILIDLLELNRIQANIRMYSESSESNIKEEIPTEESSFSLPEFLFVLNHITIGHSDFSLTMDDAEVKPNVFNTKVLQVCDFTLEAEAISLRDQTLGAELKTLSFREESGIQLKELEFYFFANDKTIELNQLKLHLNNNRLQGTTKISYSSLADWLDNPETGYLSLNFPEYQFDFRDILQFQPELRQNEAILAVSRKLFRGSLNATGNTKKINIPKFNLSWGKIRLETEIYLKNLLDTKKLSFDIPYFQVVTNRGELLNFVEEEDLGITLPIDIVLMGKAQGSLENIQVDANLLTSQGEVFAKGYWKKEEQIDFDLDLEIKEYELGQLLTKEAFGSLSFNLKAYGAGENINSLNMDLEAELAHFSYKEYPIENLLLTATIEDGEGEIKSGYKDANLDFVLSSSVIFDSIVPQANLHFDLKGINLQKLGLLDRDMRVAFVLDADFNGENDVYDIIATLGDGIVVHDNRTYLLSDLLATAHIESDTTSIWLDNKMLRLQLESNATPENFTNSIKQYVLAYFSRKEPEYDSEYRPVKMFVKGEINEDSLLNQILFTDVEKMDTVKIDLDYDEANRRLAAKINAPLIQYSGSELKNLKFNMHAIEEDFNFNLGFDHIKAGIFDLPQTKIEGKQIDKDLHLNFSAIYKDELFVSLPSIITGTSEELKLHVPSENIILNGERWNAPIDNSMLLSKQGIHFHNFEFTKGKEAVRYLNDWIPVDREQIAVKFENFNLKETLNYLNPAEEIAKGDLEGSLTMLNPFERPGLLANLAINNLSLMDVDLGVLSLKARSLGFNKYDFSLAMKEGMIDLDIKGGYTTLTEGSPEIDLKLDINELNVETLNNFSSGEIRNAEGILTGNFDLYGPLNNLKYNGAIDFKNVDFTVSKFNAPFQLIQTKMLIDNKGLYFNDFTIYDEFKNDLILNGKVLTKDFLNPSFDLKILSDNFHIMNAAKGENEFVYGKAAFDVDMSLKGDLSFPVVSMKLNISDDTDITYTMSRSTAALEKTEGIIEFVNRQDPEAVLTSKNNEQLGMGISGLDFRAKFNIGNKANLNIILDKYTGDNFKVFGDGEFDFSINPNGNITLSGIYEVAGGHYEMNLYNLVNRKFELVKGGRIVWSGDMMDAELDIKAKYDVDASAVPLMAAVSSGSDIATQNRFRQVLPFLVYLNIGGEITRPEISFDLDMPEDKQGAVGGQIFGRVQQINQQEEELNRQVFSLLVLNRFFPSAGSDGSEGGFASIVRNNINDAISDQLNSFSDKILGKSGVELVFGLDSYTDYQGENPEERTQLDIAAQKKLFDDRLIVRVGSEVDLQGNASQEEETPLIGNVSVEYLLTPNGRYSMQGFRKNTYDNIIDGQLIVSGISLIFHKEFNEYRELWQAMLRGETKQERAERKEAERLEKEKEVKKKELENLEK